LGRFNNRIMPNCSICRGKSKKKTLPVMTGLNFEALCIAAIFIVVICSSNGVISNIPS